MHDWRRAPGAQLMDPTGGMSRQCCDHRYTATAAMLPLAELAAGRLCDAHLRSEHWVRQETSIPVGPSVMVTAALCTQLMTMPCISKCRFWGLHESRPHVLTIHVASHSLAIVATGRTRTAIRKT